MAIIGLHLCDDLIFASRVRAVAAAHGITLTMVRAADELIRIAAASHPACVILDVNALNLRIDGLAPELKAQFLRSPWSDTGHTLMRRHCARPGMRGATSCCRGASSSKSWKPRCRAGLASRLALENALGQVGRRAVEIAR